MVYVCSSEHACDVVRAESAIESWRTVVSSVVRLTLNNSVILQTPAEDVRALRESEFTQVVFRLATGLPPGTYTVQILAHTRLSNGGTIRIVP
jgi:hypothetical protein